MNLVKKSVEIAELFARRAGVLRALDMTLGNGFDTLALAGLLGAGGVVDSFDIQSAALEASRCMILKEGGESLLGRCRMHCKSHEFFDECLSARELENVSVAFFNLGWLPRSDKRIVTKPQSTSAALAKLEKLFFRRAENGFESLLNVLSYRAHEGGEAEYRAVGEFFAALEKKSASSNFAEVKIEIFGDRQNPKSPVLFSARFGASVRGRI